MPRKEGRHLQRPANHEESRQRICAGCGRGGAQQVVTTTTEELSVKLKVNENEVISGPMPWITDDVDDKIQTSLGID